MTESMKSECIERNATVTAIQGRSVRLTVLRPSACSHCEAAGHCHASESRLETITLDRSQLPSEVAVGDQVSLEMRSSLGMRAVLLTMIIPTILIIAITVLLSYLEVGTLAQILIALGVAAAYMLLLWLLRDRFERTFAFTVRKK